MTDYENTEADLYEQVTNSSNPLQVWFHGSRNVKVAEFVDKYFKPDAIIADLGCGNALWNEKFLPVIGVDVNEKSLDVCLTKKRISEKIIGDTAATTLPDNSVDIVIITEVLEHIFDLCSQMREIKRILKPGGVVISSVPFDTAFSLWLPLFAVQCFYRGQLLGEQYYKEQCGHINHFSKKSIRGLFERNHFKVLEQYNHSYFTIFTIAQKQ